MAEKKKTDSNPKKEDTKKTNTATPKKTGGSKAAKNVGKGFVVEQGKTPPLKKKPRLQAQYEKIAPALQEKLGLKNKMQVPKLQKIVVSSSSKDVLVNRKVLDSIMEELAIITGQYPKITHSKKSIAAFKLREGQALGACATLRRARMYEFLDRLINVALPRVRDFKGVNPKSFDGKGNYSLGIKEQIIFPEINYDKVEKIRGMNVVVVTSAETDDAARELLIALGMPFRDIEKK